MPSGHSGARDYAFADQALALRKRAGLRQRDLAGLLHVSSQSIHAWESGLSYPGTAHLKGLIALYLARGVLASGREGEQAAALWAIVRERAMRRIEPFDPTWFTALPGTPDLPPAVPPAPPAAIPVRWDDWGDAPAVPVFQGRAPELTTLTGWVRDAHCRVVEVLGAGGIGKTAVAAQLAHGLATEFVVVYWRSLRNALPVEEWLAGAIALLSVDQAAAPQGFEARMGLLLELLRGRRALLVLDNLEAILEPEAQDVRYRDGHEGYGTLLARLAWSAHRSVLLLTSREQPLRADNAAVRALRLKGLDVAESRALLGDRRLTGGLADWSILVDRFAGNPLALRIVGETVHRVFGGDIASFLAQDTAVFGNIRHLLDEQVARLSPLEQTILNSLTVAREPVAFARLVADLGPGLPRGEVVEAVEALQRRSLLEWATGGAFTLQPVVLEYVTIRLVTALAKEILEGTPALLVRQPVLNAQARDYVRGSQERLIARPLLDRMCGSLGGAAAVERRLLERLDAWRGRSRDEQGYGPGNAINLLRVLRGDLRGLDLSHLSIRHAYLQEVTMQDASLASAQVSETVFANTFASVTGIAVSADGVHVAAGTMGGEVRVWRVEDRTPLLSLQAHAGGVMGVAFSADGLLLANGNQDGTVRLWATVDGRPLATLQGHTGGVVDVALSADGRLLASGSHDGTVRLWEMPAGRPLATLRGHTGSVWGVALSADGRLLASGGLDGTVRLWATADGRPLATLEGHTGGVWAVALSADGRLLASGSHDGTVRLWETPGGELLATLRGHTGAVWGAALSADGRLLASGSHDGTVRLWETPGGRPLATLQGHTDVVMRVAFSRDGWLLASGGLDGTVRLWEAPAGRALATLHGYTTGVWDVALSADGRLLASGSMDGMIRLWATADGRPLAALEGHTGGVVDVALSADGRLLASSSHDGTVRLWETPGGELLATLRGHTGAIFGLAFSADGRLLASGGMDGTIRFWEAPAGRALAVLEGCTGGVNSLAFSADGRLLASASIDGTVRLWEAESGRPLTTLRGHTDGIEGVAFSADGRLLASGSMDGTIRLWATEDGRPLTTLEGHTAGVWSVAFSADGRLLASGGLDGTVRLWATEDGRPLANLEGHSGFVYGVALSADGRLLASGGLDGTVRLWEAPGGTSLRTLLGDRRYERMDITGLTGVSEMQRATLRALGAVGHERAPAPASTPAATASPPPPAPSRVAPPPLPTGRRPPSAVALLVRAPTNLPPDRTTFVGRTADSAALVRALDRTTGSGTRLLTLTGVAGCGKTRLALAVAETMLDAYPDGVWLIELAPLPASAEGDPNPVVAATFSALRLREQPGEAPLDTLIAHLRTRRLLLVMDNCEHVVAACATLLAHLLRACPDVQILATSQLTLGAAHETIWRVEPLSVPPHVEAPTVQLLEQAEAVQLFLQRAQAVHPAFVLSALSAASVAAICRRLDGLPLAIELAAARLNVLPVDDVLDRLDDRFQLLRRGGRAVVDRHQTLQATMDWSYGLLNPAERAVLRRLAVFAGGWELSAAERVCAMEPVASEDVLEVLDELHERSLVYVQQQAEVPRYGLLETVRHYGAQQLEREDETAAVRELHLTWCVALAGQAALALLGPEQSAWMARLAREHDNLRAALQWSLDRGLGTAGLQVAGGLGKFWLRGGYQREGRRWLAALLALPADRHPAGMAARATALEAAAGLAEDAHEFAQASALFAESGALRGALGDDEPLATSMINAAMEARAGGDYVRATQLLEECLVQYRRIRGRTSRGRHGLGPLLSFAYRYTLLALVLTEQGAYTRATALCEECLALAQQAGDLEGIGVALLSLADVARDQGEAARVRSLGEQSLALFRDLGHAWAIGFSLNNLAQAAFLEGDLTLAATHAEEGAALFRGMGAGPSLAEVLITVARVRAARGEAIAARAHLVEALELTRERGPRLVAVAAIQEFGVQAIRQGRAALGVRLLSAAGALRRVMGTPARPADRAAIDGALVSARASLGELAFDGAWATGQTLSVDQVVAMLGDDGQPRPPGLHSPQKP